MPPETEIINADKEQQVDPHALRLMKAFGKSLSDLDVPEDGAVIDPNMPVMTPEPIGTERTAEKGTLKVAVAAAATEKTDDEKAAEKKIADDKAAADKAKADADAAEAAKKKPPITLVRREPTQPKVEVPPEKKEPTATEAAAADKKKADDEYEATLTAKERRMIEVARHAESKGKKGLTDATFKYLRDTEKYLEEHPEHGQDSEELSKFLADNDPFKGDDFHELAADMREDRAYRRAREDVSKEFEPTQREVRELQLQPIISKAVSDVARDLVSVDPENKEVLAFDKAVVDSITQKGYQAAVEEFPLEAPIVQGTLNAAQAWLRISRGAKAPDENNATDAWVMGFVARESGNMLRQPKEAQIKDGKTFLPMGDYIKKYGDYHKPSNEHWTFDDEMIVGMIAASGRLALTEEVKRLERSGFKRAEKIAPDKKDVPADKKYEVNDKDENGSPRAGGKIMSGTGETSDSGGGLLANFPSYKGLHKLMGGQP